MKKINSFFFTIALAGTIIACNNNSETETMAVSPGTEPIPVPSQTVTPVSPSANPASTEINPPHGQPGHRCDNPTGATHSAPPVNNVAPASGGITLSNPASPQQIITPAPAPQAPTQTAPGMNPAHGQPGHDCAIAVGAPLKK